MNAFIKAIGLVLLSLVMSPSVWAVGTNAGTDIVNTATATYNVGATTGLTETSNTTTTTVDEVLDVNVVWQDAANVTVSPGDTNQVTTYLITNTGNGTDDYTLTGSSSLAGDNFDPTLVNIFLDSNSNGTYDGPLSTTPDVQYVAGTNDPVLTANNVSTESLIVFVLNDIPTPLADGALGNTQITVTTNADPTPTAGEIIPGGGDGGTDAVIGSSAGTASDIGTYVVSNVAVSVVKSASVLDASGVNPGPPIPGAVIRYTIVVTASGPGTATGVVITDPIPANTTFNTGTLILNGISPPLTDGVAGDDAGDVGITTAGVMTVSLIDLDNASSDQTITFDVTIQ